MYVCICIWACIYMCIYMYICIQDIFYISIYLNIKISFSFVARILGILISLATGYHVTASEIQHNSFTPLDKA